MSDKTRKAITKRLEGNAKARGLTIKEEPKAKADESKAEPETKPA